MDGRRREASSDVLVKLSPHLISMFFPAAGASGERMAGDDVLTDYYQLKNY